jgi:lysozyme
MSAAALINEFEGCELVAYKKGKDVWTIGRGHTLAVYPGQTCTQGQADGWAQADEAEARDALLHVSPGPYAPGALDALTDFVFNLGIGRYRTSTLRILVDDGNWPAAKLELLKWDHEDGVVVAGLLRRRQAEADLIEVA